MPKLPRCSPAPPSGSFCTSRAVRSRVARHRGGEVPGGEVPGGEVPGGEAPGRAASDEQTVESIIGRIQRGVRTDTTTPASRGISTVA
jgi:hypothetical protein